MEVEVKPPNAVTSASPRWGRRAVLVLAPQLAAGLWLVLVPDHAAFIATQWIVIAHVLGAALTLPLFVVWIARHVRRHRERGLWRRSARLKAAVGVLLATVAAAAYGSGVLATTSSDGMPAGEWHAVFGLAVALPLFLHVMVVRQRRLLAGLTFGLATVAGVGLMVSSTAGGPEANREEHTGGLQPTARYDSATWCADCHRDHFDEWRHSAHSRAMQAEHTRSIIGHAIEAQGAPNVDNDATAVLPSCTSCHAPVTFYGDDTTPLLQATGTVREGITCSFCHTLRGTDVGAIDGNVSPEVMEVLRQKGLLNAEGDIPAPLRDGYLAELQSDPGSVRRYLFQADERSLLRFVGDLLIRWRPAVHRADYASPFLKDPQACAACHVTAFPDWRGSRFDREGVEDDVRCQSCHMTAWTASEPRAAIVPGRHVPWGPTRSRRHSHLFLGGNARLARTMHDREMAEASERFSRGSVSVRIRSARVQEGRVTVEVELRSEVIGHSFPVGEVGEHRAVIQLAITSESGAAIRSTAQPAWARTSLGGEADPDHASIVIGDRQDEEPCSRSAARAPMSSRSRSTRAPPRRPACASPCSITSRRRRSRPPRGPSPIDPRRQDRPSSFITGDSFGSARTPMARLETTTGRPPPRSARVRAARGAPRPRTTTRRLDGGRYRAARSLEPRSGEPPPVAWLALLVGNRREAPRGPG